MVSFVNGTLLKEEPCCNFMLKHDIKYYFQQSTKTLSTCFQWNTAHKDLFSIIYDNYDYRILKLFIVVLQ